MRDWESPIVLTALFIFSAWLFVVLPIIYGLPHVALDMPSQQPSSRSIVPDLKPSIVALTRGSPTAPFYVETTYDNQDHNADCNRGWWQKLWTDPIATFTGALFLATLFQVIFTWRALQESRKANEAARAAESNTNSALVISSRPYVFVRDFAPIPVGNPQQPFGWRCVVIWENSGATPTQNLRMRVNWASFQNKLSDDYDFPDLGGNEGESAVVIPPRAQTTTTAFTLTFENAISLIEERMFTYIWGWAEYSDIFPNTPKRRTEFCVRVLATLLSDNPPMMMVEFRHHGTHNRAN